MNDSIETRLDAVYNAMEGNEMAEEYSLRHGLESAAILTVYNDERAALIAQHLAPRISDKTVIEIGGGIGLLGMHLAEFAKRVFVIEAQPSWSWVFVGCLYARKPKNMNYLFGAASEFKGLVHGDIALFCTYSGHKSMSAAARSFAPVVIDVYKEILALREKRET